MGVAKYMECSAKTGEGVDGIFEEGVRIVLDKRAEADDAVETKQDKPKRMGALGQLLCF